MDQHVDWRNVSRRGAHPDAVDARRRRPLARQAGRVLAASYLVVAMAACSADGGCGGLFGGSCGSSIEYEGARYSGMTAQDLRIDQADLELIGTADETTSQVSSRDVYALDGVDPANIVVLEAQADAAEEYILYTRGDLQYTAGFCQYYIEPPPECG